MKRRFIIAIIVFGLIVAAAFALANLYGAIESDFLAFIIVPFSVLLLPPILLPRKGAVIWHMATAAVAILLFIASLERASSCSGDGCIGMTLLNFLVLLPIAIISAILALIRFLKAPRDVAGNDAP